MGADKVRGQLGNGPSCASSITHGSMPEAHQDEHRHADDEQRRQVIAPPPDGYADVLLGRKVERSEASLLLAFDTHRAGIHAVAITTCKRERKGSYELVAADFSSRGLRRT